MKTLDQRVVELEQALNSVGSALQNTLMAVVTSLNNQPDFDRIALQNELEEIKGVHIENGNQRLYTDAISMVQDRLK
ncbi:hypothetical protein PAGU2196_11650 [Pseudomonas sp. PAGU 2196]|uniref:hypothetical protein n=1 Tax=Pseudomonas sp. PAGU 2196 TaxID=2793997 RepID=UPI001EDD4001|nr:hypothetical protein [Pseudomonas sp. PAGU 2196]GHS80331.1 hypothetical protein PAGU2196_11650 [Pseudomonas sp. PAGU 2196]